MPAANPFKRVVPCSTDDFPKDNDKIKGWVEHWGGKYTKEIDSTVTHLLASKRAFKSNIEIVRQARKHKNIKIVKFDWLEDSLLGGKKPKPLPTPKYEHDQMRFKKHTHRKIPKIGDSKRKESSSPETGVSAWLQPQQSQDCPHPPTFKAAQQAKTDAQYNKIEKYGMSLDIVSTQSELDELKSGYHLYRDPLANFEYSINLVRKDILTKCLERHRMKILESDATTLVHGRKQHTYIAFSKYLTVNNDIQTIEIAPIGSTLDLVMCLWKLYFKNRTAGIQWDVRKQAISPQGMYGGDGSGAEWYYDMSVEDEDGGGGGVRIGGEELKPCATMMLSEDLAGEVIDARAMTPEAGW